MNLLNYFKKHLLEDTTEPSKATVKNYIADIRKFINWYEKTYSREFDGRGISKDVARKYKEIITSNEETGSPAPRSAKRYLSSLRKFFNVLEEEEIVDSNPFAINIDELKTASDPWYLGEFKNFLYVSNLTDLSSKNYIADIRQFLQWWSQVAKSSGKELNEKELLNVLDEVLIEEYKSRMLNEANLSPLSVNRKLSSLRKYLAWMQKKGVIHITFAINDISLPKEEKNSQNDVTEKMSLNALSDFKSKPEKEAIDEKPTYSRFGPFRWFQKSSSLIGLVFDSLILFPIVKSAVATKYTLWKMSGRQVFAPTQEVFKQALPHLNPIDINFEAKSMLGRSGSMNANNATFLEKLVGFNHKPQFGNIHNISKSIYAPLNISTKHLSWKKRLIHSLRYKRPNWYKKYHSHAIVHYMHFAVVIIFATALGFGIYKGIFERSHSQPNVLAALPNSPPRMLAFQGKLTDSLNTPINADTPLRFSIYNSETATGSALLWQEVQNVVPDSQGKFSVVLGKNTRLQQNVFSNNANIFLGITIARGNELQPRQQIATVGYSANAKTLQGLSPITQPHAGTSNVLLALDSSGNLTIGGSASPTFQATGGDLTLSGQTLTLTTNSGSNTNVEIKPDGFGIIDLQKPIQNTTKYSNIPGVQSAVEVDDTLAILATTSAQSALVINQNSTGDLISASTSGIAKFRVDNSGTGTFANNLSVNGNYFNATATNFNLLNTNTLNLNIGGFATAITLGASSGNTAINNSLQVNGVTNLRSAVNASGVISANAGLIIPLGKKLTFSGFTSGSIPFINASKEIDTDTNKFFWDMANSRLGLGTSIPAYRLDLQDSNSGDVVARIYNSDSGTSADGLSVKLGNNSNTTVATSNHFINFETQGIGLVGSIQGNGSNGIQLIQNGLADYAEYMEKNASETIPFGSILCVNTNGKVTACTQDNKDKIVGIASPHPMIIAGQNLGDGSIPVALTGIVETNVSTGSGAITAGDMITASEIAGVGVKASKNGLVVGQALESYQGNDIGTIKVSVHINWFETDLNITKSGDLSLAKISHDQSNDSYKLDTPLGEAIDHVGTFSKAVIANIQAGAIDAQTISTKSLSVTSQDITIGGQTFHDYIATIVSQIVSNQQTLLASTNALRTNLISPLSSTSAIAVTLDNSAFKVHAHNTATSAAVATIDNQGNASFSGTLTATDSTLSGTLRVKRIIADEIVSPNQTATQSANYITNIYNSISSPSAIPATPTPGPTILPSSEPSHSPITINNSIFNQTGSLSNTNLANAATFSAELAYVPNLQADFARFNQGLIALGPSSFTDAYINSQLHIGSNMMISDNSLDTLGSDLNLQPLRQGNLSVMGGLFVIDTEGNINSSGNATFAKNVTVKGKLAANIISPLADSDLKVSLGKNSSLRVGDGSESKGFIVNQTGDVAASGSGKFATLAANAFQIVRGAQADTSMTETVASGSAGWAIITANETERTIFSPYVTKDSLIYITLTSDTQGVTPYLARQTAEDITNQTKGSFTIEIPNQVSKDIKVNWWIVN